MLGSRVSMAVRNKDGEIVLEDLSQGSVATKKLFRVPFLRGFVSLYYSLYFGIKALNRSAEISSGESVKKSELLWTTLFAFGLAIGLFVLLPMWITGLFDALRKNEVLFAVVEGASEIDIFRSVRLDHIVLSRRKETLSVPRRGAYGDQRLRKL